MGCAHFNREMCLRQRAGHDAVGGVCRAYSIGNYVAVVDVMKRDGTTRFFQFAAGGD